MRTARQSAIIIQSPQPHLEKKIKVAWKTFISEYLERELSLLKPETAQRVLASLEALERIASPRYVSDVTDSALAKLVAHMRAKGNAPSTIRTNMINVRSALKWANGGKRLRRQKKSRVMKGRPLSDEEFLRMLEAVPLVDAEHAGAWTLFLQSLWAGGLRLSEALLLSWDIASPFSIDASGRRMLLRVRADGEKGGQHRLMPLAPEFVDVLESLPRGGLVHRLPVRSKESVSRVVSRIGEAAGIIVNHHPLKYASAHDLRRSFGERWARRVMPAILMQLMRHESIETTLRYYVGREAETTADILYKAAGGGEMKIAEANAYEWPRTLCRMLRFRYPEEIFPASSNSPDACAAKGIRLVCEQIRLLIREKIRELERD